MQTQMPTPTTPKHQRRPRRRFHLTQYSMSFKPTENEESTVKQCELKTKSFLEIPDNTTENARFVTLDKSGI